MRGHGEWGSIWIQCRHGTPQPSRGPGKGSCGCCPAKSGRVLCGLDCRRVGRRLDWVRLKAQGRAWRSTHWALSFPLGEGTDQGLPSSGSGRPHCWVSLAFMRHSSGAAALPKDLAVWGNGTGLQLGPWTLQGLDLVGCGNLWVCQIAQENPKIEGP